MEAAEPTKGPQDYEITGWVNTLIEAEEIKADAKKMKLVMPLLEKKKASLHKALKTAGKAKSFDEARAQVESMPDDEE